MLRKIGNTAMLGKRWMKFMFMRIDTFCIPCSKIAEDTPERSVGPTTVYGGGAL